MPKILVNYQNTTWILKMMKSAIYLNLNEWIWKQEGYFSHPCLLGIKCLRLMGKCAKIFVYRLEVSWKQIATFLV